MKMNKNLLIIGASTYGVVAAEIATDMGCFEKIDFVDDERNITPNGIEVIGTTRDIDELASQYSNMIVAIGNLEVRLSFLKKIEEKMPSHIISLVSPKAYVSPSAQIMHAEYSNTSELVKLIAEVHGKKVWLVNDFDWALKIMSKVTGLVNKAFGSLSYDMEISEYKVGYIVADLEESIKRTEKYT